MVKIKNIRKWLKVLDSLGIDIGDFDITKLASLGSDSGLDDVLGLFDDSEKDVDKDELSGVLDSVGSLTSLLGDSDDEDDDDNVLGNVLGMLSDDDSDTSGGFGSLLGGLGGLLGDSDDDDKDDKKDDDDDSPLDTILGLLK